MAEFEPSRLIGTWVHSHEESGRDRLVFRPPDYSFPPSRGRMSIELAPDGMVVSGGPGPDDRRATASGTWRLDGDVLTINAPFLSGTYEIESATKVALVVRKH